MVRKSGEELHFVNKIRRNVKFVNSKFQTNEFIFRILVRRNHKRRSFVRKSKS